MLNATLINQASDFDSLPFELTEEAIKLMKDVVIRNDSQAKKIILLLTGVWPTDDHEKPFILLPWSPLNKTISDVSAVNLAQIATQWVLNTLASTILLLDSRSWELFKLKYPQPCSQYLLKGDVFLGWLSLKANPYIFQGFAKKRERARTVFRRMNASARNISPIILKYNARKQFRGF